LKTLLGKHLSDVLILTGSSLIIYATWLLSWIAAIYVAGGILITLGVLIGIGGRVIMAAPMERGEE
jgi:hypothetical protein